MNPVGFPNLSTLESQLHSHAVTGGSRSERLGREVRNVKTYCPTIHGVDETRRRGRRRWLTDVQ